jgi:hypothetical protein
MDSTIARLFYRAAKRAVVREAPAPQPKKKSRREETGGAFRTAAGATRAVCKIKAIMDGLTADAVFNSNPFDASFQSIYGGGAGEDFGDEWQPSNYSSLGL